MLFKQQDCRRSELLADRAGLEDAVPRGGYAGIEICKTVALRHHDLSVLTAARAIPGIARRDISVEINWSIFAMVVSDTVTDASAQSTVMKNTPR
jgi:hypothetical protein